MKIYVASSWRNRYQPAVVEICRAGGHDTYDFRNPPTRSGFSWSEIDPNWESWTPDQYREALQHPCAKAGYASDIGALDACDMCILVLPSGRSASWESGYAMGKARRSMVVMLEKCEPELMYREAEIVTTVDKLLASVGVTDLAKARLLQSGALRRCDFRDSTVSDACGKVSIGDGGINLCDGHRFLVSIYE